MNHSAVQKSLWVFFQLPIRNPTGPQALNAPLVAQPTGRPGYFWCWHKEIMPTVGGCCSIIAFPLNWFDPVENPRNEMARSLILFKSLKNPIFYDILFWLLLITNPLWIMGYHHFIIIESWYPQPEILPLIFSITWQRFFSRLGSDHQQWKISVVAHLLLYRVCNRLGPHLPHKEPPVIVYTASLWDKYMFSLGFDFTRSDLNMLMDYSPSVYKDPDKHGSLAPWPKEDRKAWPALLIPVDLRQQWVSDSAVLRLFPTL